MGCCSVFTGMRPGSFILMPEDFYFCTTNGVAVSLFHADSV